MSKIEEFKAHIEKGYQFKGESVVLGTAMLDGAAVNHTLIKAPLKTFNRHGLISGATGTGKTKTLQNLSERLSENGVSVLLMDIKGDLSGLSQAGGGHPKIDERHEKIGVPWVGRAYPIELMTISESDGVRMRATVSEFGPVLFSKILDVNATQTGIISLVFKYCDDKRIPLLDLKDFRKALQYLTDEGKEEIKDYGRISPASTGAILRKVIEIEEQDADLFFGERSFDVKDLVRKNEEGLGFINVLKLTDIQDRPKLFSTFMLCLLAEIYESFPEVGDKEAPKLVIFIDEAHLIFKEASKALLSQIETIIKLIRSKGVGVFFSTQMPTDVPDYVLGQLGMKIQHALRAFTAKDRKAIKLTAENYPLSDYYKTSDVLTKLGIGEALVTVLNEKGIPTPLVHGLLTAPSSRMDIISSAEENAIINASDLISKYNEDIDRDSAYEILNRKIERAAEISNEEKELEEERKKRTSSKSGSRRTTSSRRRRSNDTALEKLSKSRVVNTIARELTRGLLGVLGMK